MANGKNNKKTYLRGAMIVPLLLFLHASATSAFATASTASFLCSPLSSRKGPPFRCSSLALASSLSQQRQQPDVVVISPPGGIGEIASVEAARLGGSVKWFVVSASSPVAATSSMTADTLAAIQKAGGSLELAGAAADSLLAPPDDDDNSNSALSAMTSWIAFPKSLICTYEGATAEKQRVNRMKTPEQIKNSVGVDEEELVRCGIRVAAQQAVVAGNPRKVAVLATGEEIVVAQKDDDQKGGISGLIAGLFGGNEVNIPKSMAEAMKGDVSVIRYGELFGAAESSVSCSYCVALSL